MSPIELLSHATDAQRRWKADGLSGDAVVQLTMSRERRPTGRTVRLFGDRGPKGDVSLVRPDGSAWKVVAVFPAAAVAGWISKAARQAGIDVADGPGSVERDDPVARGS